MSLLEKSPGACMDWRNFCACSSKVFKTDLNYKNLYIFEALIITKFSPSNYDSSICCYSRLIPDIKHFLDRALALIVLSHI